LEGKNPKAWKDALNLYLRMTWEKASKESAVGATSNAAGNFRKMVYGTNQLENMKAAMGRERFKNFSELLDVLEASSRVSGGQSVTHFAMEGEKAFQRRAAPIVSFSTRFRDFWISMRSDQFKEKMAAIITGPDASRRLPELAKLSKNSERARAIVAMLAVRSGAAEIEDFWTPGGPTQIPEAVQ